MSTPTKNKLAELRESRRRWKKLAQIRAQLLQKEHFKNARLRAGLMECERRATSQQPGGGHFGIAGVARAVLKTAK